MRIYLKYFERTGCDFEKKFDYLKKTGLDLNSVKSLKGNLLELKKNKIIIVITHEKKLQEISDIIVKL